MTNADDVVAAFQHPKGVSWFAKIAALGEGLRTGGNATRFEAQPKNFSNGAIECSIADFVFAILYVLHDRRRTQQMIFAGGSELLNGPLPIRFDSFLRNVVEVIKARGVAGYNLPGERERNVHR